MNAPDKPPREALTIGAIVLERKGERVIATHEKLRKPVDIDPGQLARWLLRHIREQVAL